LLIRKDASLVTIAIVLQRIKILNKNIIFDFLEDNILILWRSKGSCCSGIYIFPL